MGDVVEEQAGVLGDRPGDSRGNDALYQAGGARGRCGPRSRSTLAPADSSYVREGVQANIMLARTYLRQDQPKVDHPVSPASRAVRTLTGQVGSARVVGQLARLVGDFAPIGAAPQSASSPHRSPDSSSNNGSLCRRAWEAAQRSMGAWGGSWRILGS